MSNAMGKPGNGDLKVWTLDHLDHLDHLELKPPKLFGN